MSEDILEFPSKLTPKGLKLGLAPLALGAYLVYYSGSVASQFAPSDPSRYLFASVPLLLGLVILITTVVGTFLQLRKRVTISRREVVYFNGANVVFTSPWASLAFSPPMPGKRAVRSLLLSDGTKMVQFYDIFLPDFDRLLNEVERRKGSSMASGRIRMSDPTPSGRVNV